MTEAGIVIEATRTPPFGAGPVSAFITSAMRQTRSLSDESEPTGAR